MIHNSKLFLQFCFTFFFVIFVRGNSDLFSYPKVQFVFAKNENHKSIKFTTSNQTDGSVRVEIHEKLSRIRQLIFSCNSIFPTEWLFDCPLSQLKAPFNITKRVQWNKTVFRDEYFSNLTISINFDNAVDIDNAEDISGISNVTCQLVENQKIGTYLAFRTSLTENLRFDIGTGVNGNKSGCEAEKSYNKVSSKECPTTITVDLKTATYACPSKHHEISCQNKIDFCSSLTKYNNNLKQCIQYTRGEKWEIALSPSIIPRVIKCGGSDDSLWAKCYAVIDGKSEDLKYYKNKEEALQRPDALQFIPNVTILFHGQMVEFVCKGWSSLFAQGALFSHNYTNGSDHIATNSESFESLGYMITKTTFRVYQNMSGTEISCKIPVVNSRSWKSEKLQFSGLFAVHPSKHPQIEDTGTKSFPNGTFTCNASGIPTPSIKWFHLKHINVQHEIPQLAGAGIKFKWAKKSFNFSIVSVGNYTEEDVVVCRAENVIGSVEFTFPNKKQNSEYMTVIIVVVVVSIAVIICIVAVSIAYFHRRRRVELSREECEEFYSGIKTLNQSDPLSGALLLSYDIRFEVPRNKIKMEENVLGSGQFGIVIQGKYKGDIVAVKTIRPTTDIAYFKALLCELKILQYIGSHPNVVNLLGACTTNIRKMEVLLLLDFCENGNLVKFLRSCRTSFIDSFHISDDDAANRQPLYQNSSVRTLTSKDLVRISLEIAIAMEFIAEKKILHGDLAARNVLVTGDKHVKICDFGLAKQLHEYSVYIQKQECPLPLRWMAIESLQDMEFSIESDVWSYGITLWEIFTLAELPYPGVNWGFDSWRMLKDGYRLENPQYSNVSLYLLMRECWKNDPGERPKFSYLVKALQNELDLLRELE